MINRFTKYHVLMGSLLILSILALLFQVPLTSSQGVNIVAASITGDLPVDDPNSPLWEEATAVEIQLNAQTITRPLRLDPSVRSMTVRALHNDSQVAFLLIWNDTTEDTSALRVTDFSDGAAIQFSLAETLPSFCMGQVGGNVNIWHWKANWQANLLAKQDMETVYPNMYVDNYPFADADLGAFASIDDYIDMNYITAIGAGNLYASGVPNSSVEDLNAGGFGTLDIQPLANQNVQGYGVWDADQWYVIFSRDLASDEENDVSLGTRQVFSIAFAVWDGSEAERNGQKSTSQWLSLELAE